MVRSVADEDGRDGACAAAAVPVTKMVGLALTRALQLSVRATTAVPLSPTIFFLPDRLRWGCIQWLMALSVRRLFRSFLLE